MRCGTNINFEWQESGGKKNVCIGPSTRSAKSPMVTLVDQKPPRLLAVGLSVFASEPGAVVLVVAAGTEPEVAHSKALAVVLATGSEPSASSPCSQHIVLPLSGLARRKGTGRRICVSLPIRRRL